MTIEEAIKHAEEVSEANERGVQDAIELGEQNPPLTEIEDCLKCAKEHRQLAEWLKELKRARTLLKATYELLNKQKESCYVLNILGETVFYDEAECSGKCLMEDIDALMGEYYDN